VLCCCDMVQWETIGRGVELAVGGGYAVGMVLAVL